ncbi:hypothetical protein MuYL_2980 [Mucilaginibacter xinganensis]|uniref:Uncharacterized protein n=1 Tax=Mucilaginibacter xinganensis TaxID=1234841 RepID=A0A223NYC2_9SPHI|nr:hypothetical protein MuYL_2980 [Mucilaginibacter xinganensis]
MNSRPVCIQLVNTKNALYHNRTVAVTEAYALICYFRFK